MKILEVDERQKLIRIRVDNEDDLWELYNLLYSGDIVIGRTTREVKTQTSSWRRPVTLSLKVEWAEMQPMTNRLRIHGIVLESPEDLEIKGKHHTIVLEPGSVITVLKPESWNELDLKRLKTAEQRTVYNALIASIDSEDFAVARITNSGVQLLYQEKVELRTKNKEGSQDIETRELKRIGESLKGLVQEIRPQVLIISGPSIYLEKLRKAVKERIGEIRMIGVETSYGGYPGIREALSKEALRDALKESEAYQEQELMEEFLARIGRDEPVAYGLEPVERASEIGAVETLLIERDLMADPVIRERVVKVVERVLSSRGRVKVFTSNDEARIWLKNMGGIAALLRYRVDLSRPQF